MLWLYRFAHAFWFSAVVLSLPFSRKTRLGLWGRRGLTSRVRAHRTRWSVRPYWFHFASSGEFEQAIPILEDLRCRAPLTPIFLTYFSPSGARAVELETRRRAEAGVPLVWDASDYSPLDFPWTASGFVKTLCPQALVILNREFWPETLEACFREHVPVHAAAVFLSARARRWLRFFRPWLRRLKAMGTTDEASLGFLRAEIPGPELECLGDPRMERVLDRKRFAREGIVAKRPVFLAASVWPADFEALGPTLTGLLKNGWAVWIVPHEPKEGFLQVLESWFARQGIPAKRRAAGDPLAQVVLVNSVGRLAELYQSASLAFVGGSFRARIHNVLEPAAHGVALFSGPFIENSREALCLRDLGALRVASDSGILREQVLRASKQEPERLAQGRLAKSFLENGRGVGARYGVGLTR